MTSSVGEPHGSQGLILDGATLRLEEIARFLGDSSLRVALAPEACGRVVEARRVVERVVALGAPVYGVNTGFGRLADQRIPPESVRQLQLNLVRSHCCGVGDPLSVDETRLLMLLRANALAKGCSGLRLETLASLIAMLNLSVLPIVPERGSVGASGDLAPLAHLARGLIGEGDVRYRGERMPASEALAAADLAPVVLEAKEGLSLINGTQLMTAIGCKLAVEARRLLLAVDVVAALTIDALKGTDAAFDARIHAARPHPGQIACGQRLRALLQGSAIRASHKDPHTCDKVQDPYSLRCAPQVHGASADALVYVEGVLEREINAATDNPLVFAEEGAVLSGGNFHGQPVALALDVATLAIAELGSIAERRIERLVNPDYSGLPPFLVRGKQGLNSGFMMAQVTAAALVSENKTLAHPASVDSIPTSAGFEDHVSMGVTAALKARACLRNVEIVCGIELLVAAQAIDFHAPLTTSPALAAAHACLRERVAPLEEDRALADDIAAATDVVRSGALLETVRR
ncbi:MAG: histidine ammonia-lyase, partial [Planctomycetota bacterium]